MKKSKEVNSKKIAAKKRVQENLFKGASKLKSFLYHIAEDAFGLCFTEQKLAEKRKTKALQAYKKVLHKEEKGLEKWQNKLKKIYSEDDDLKELTEIAITGWPE